MDIKLIIILIAIIAAETVAQYFLQKHVNLNNKLFFVLGVILYAAVGAGYSILLRHGKKLAIANSLFNAGSEITVALLGFILFGQKLSYKQIIGVVLTLVGVNLLG